MDNLSFSYILKRSKRKSLGITISGGAVVVRAPIFATQAAIDGFLREKQQWIEKCVAKQQSVDARYAPLREYAVVPILGKLLGVEMGKRYVDEDSFVVFARAYEKDKKSAVRAGIMQFAKKYLLERLESVAQAARIKYKTALLSTAKRQWGNCRSDNVIRLNFRLVCLSQKYIDYVIIHELCHTVHKNHSAAFYKLVSSYIPNYKTIRTELKQFAQLNDIY